MVFFYLGYDFKALFFSIWAILHNELKHGKSPFWQDNALFASKAKINVLLKLFRVKGSLRGPGVKKEFHKMLILVFEVIVQSAPKHTYEIGFFFHI